MQDEQHQDAQDDDTGSAAIAIGLLVLAVIGIVAGIVIATWDSGSEAADEGDDIVLVPGDDAEGEDQVDDDVVIDDGDDEVIGADHPLVGMTELEVRERYPLVRVVEVDGTPRPATMDLQYGRVNLRLADGVVVGADVEGCGEDVSEELAWAMQACEPSEDDGPTVSGVASVDGDAIALVDADDEYYEGMALGADDETFTRVSSLDGEILELADIEDGEAVRVWTYGGCRESSPVQCSVGAIVVEARG